MPPLTAFILMISLGPAQNPHTDLLLVIKNIEMLSPRMHVKGYEHCMTFAQFVYSYTPPHILLKKSGLLICTDEFWSLSSLLSSLLSSAHYAFLFMDSVS